MITKPGLKGKRCPSFYSLLVTKLRKDITATTGRRPRLHVLRRGSTRVTGVIQFHDQDVDVTLLQRLLEGYGVPGRIQSEILIHSEVEPEDMSYVICRNQLYVNFKYGVGSDLADLLERDVRKKK